MKKTALTIGKFNGFHLGHQMLLKDIAEVAEREEMTPKILKLVTSDSGIFDSAEIAQFLENEFPSIKDIEYDLNMAKKFHCPHVSCYQLTFEENTPFFYLLKKGDISTISENQAGDTERDEG